MFKAYPHCVGSEKSSFIKSNPVNIANVMIGKIYIKATTRSNSRDHQEGGNERNDQFHKKQTNPQTFYHALASQPFFFKFNFSISKFSLNCEFKKNN